MSLTGHASDPFGNGTVITPTTASGGTGSVADLQADDDTEYVVAKGATMTVGGFGNYTGPINSVYLFAQYSVDSGYGGTNALRVNGTSTTIVPADRDYGRWAYTEITGGSFGIDTAAEIQSMTVTFANNDGGSGDSVFFDCVYVVVNPQAAIPLHPTWLEDFNGTGQANPLVWNYEVGYQRNNELQYYVPGATNGWQEGGNFIIEGRKDTANDYPGYNYTSASIVTSNKYYWKFGRAQIRAQIPVNAGMWPAIWGTGETGQWPHNGEVDIMEYYQNKILANCAVGTTQQWTAKWDASNRTMTSLTAVDPDWKTQWHIWTMQWDDQNVRLYVDNILMNTIPQTWLKNTDGYNASWGPQYPFQSNGMSCWLNLAMGGAGGDPTQTMNSGPQRYLIDYWKIWEGATGNVAPTDIALDSDTVAEGVPTGTVVGNLTALDADPAEVHRYTLVTGTGSTHNSQFAIPEFVSDNTLAGVLKTATMMNAADGPTRSIRVRVTDIEGATYDKIMTVNVLTSGYLVIYNGNGNTGGSVPVDGNSYTEGATATALDNSNGLTRSGFTFSGWNTSADGTGTSYEPGETFAIGASHVNLYALWTPIPSPEGSTVYTGANGAWNADSWNNSINWNNGAGPVPDGSVNVEVASGKSPWAINPTPEYTGNLTLRSNSTLGLGVTTANNTANALGTSTNASTITMEAGSKIIMRYGAAYTFNQNIALTGNATIQLSESTNAHSVARTFASPITGASDFFLIGQNGNVANLNATNGFSSLTASVVGTSNWKVVANAAGSLGNGDVTINSAVNLVIGQPNAMDPSRALRLNGVRSNKVSGENKLVLNAGLTVAEFWLDGVQMATGTYTSSSDLLDSGGSPLISGTGTLTVTGITGPGPVASFEISPIASPQTVGTSINGITITAKDASNNTATGFTGAVTFGGTGGFSGSSASFTAGVLSDVSVTPTAAGNDLTLTVDNGSGQTGSTTIPTIQSIYASWASGNHTNPLNDTSLGGNPDGDYLINLQEFAFGTDPTVYSGGSITYVPGGEVTSPGLPVVVDFAAGGGGDSRAVFGRRKDHASAGLTYIVQFSVGLDEWFNSTTTPTVLTGAGSSGTMEAVSVPFPSSIPTATGLEKPTFFRVGVSQAAP
ncbi:MAG TPA: family 16 glycosylhydrolase [Luteolibacter sp.]|nr:family 16 glycosylhydrolase [Luteolibacter sp.]